MEDWALLFAFKTWTLEMTDDQKSHLKPENFANEFGRDFLECLNYFSDLKTDGTLTAMMEIVCPHCDTRLQGLMSHTEIDNLPNGFTKTCPSCFRPVEVVKNKYVFEYKLK